LARRSRAARDPVARSHDQISWLLSTGKTTGAVLAATGHSRRWLRQLADEVVRGRTDYHWWPQAV
jgi:hypothetical protein